MLAARRVPVRHQPYSGAFAGKNVTTKALRHEEAKALRRKIRQGTKKEEKFGSSENFFSFLFLAFLVPSLLRALVS